MVMNGGSPEAKVRICNECFTDGLAAIARSGLDLALWVAAAVKKEAQDENLPRGKYADIDNVIDDWISRYGLKLCTEWVGEARYWYTNRDKECFQISIDRLKDNAVVVHAFSVETDDDIELHGEWTVAKEELVSALATATKLIDQWAIRTRLAT